MKVGERSQTTVGERSRGPIAVLRTRSPSEAEGSEVQCNEDGVLGHSPRSRHSYHQQNSTHPRTLYFVIRNSLNGPRAKPRGTTSLLHR